MCVGSSLSWLWGLTLGESTERNDVVECVHMANSERCCNTVCSCEEAQLESGCLTTHSSRFAQQTLQTRTLPLKNFSKPKFPAKKRGKENSHISCLKSHEGKTPSSLKTISQSINFARKNGRNSAISTQFGKNNWEARATQATISSAVFNYSSGLQNYTTQSIFFRRDSSEIKTANFVSFLVEHAFRSSWFAL